MYVCVRVRVVMDNIAGRVNLISKILNIQFQCSLSIYKRQKNDEQAKQFIVSNLSRAGISCSQLAFLTNAFGLKSFSN